MTGRNTYATLAEFKAYRTSRNGTASIDSADDVVIDQLLESSSRYIDDQTSRFFYPRIETRVYSIPEYPNDSRQLDFEADLQEVISFLNGDNTSISSTAYNLLPKNDTPKFALEIKQTSSIVWQSDSNGDSDCVLDVVGIYGYHNNYSEAWKTAGTLGAAITDTSTLAFTMTAGHILSVGKIVKIDNELFIIDTIATNTITPLKRGDNGSTSATHLNGATVYIYEPMQSLRHAIFEMAERAYKRRFGQSQGNDSTVTSAGFVLPPKDVPSMTKEFISKYQRRV